MKRILIISYHFAPLNVAASHRAVGYARHLRDFGWDPTILTFDWGKPEPLAARIIQIAQPPEQSLKWLWKIPLISTLCTWWAYRSGNFDWHVASYETAIKKELEDLLIKEDFDVMMGIYSPHFHFKHCAEFSKTYGVSFVMDFRDLWHNQAMNPNHEFSFREKIRHQWIKKYWHQWSEGMSGFVSVAPAFVARLKQLFDKPGESVLNGFDGLREEAVEKLPHFTIAHFGRLLPTKEIAPFFAGLAQFQSDHRKPVRVVFYAADNALQHRIIEIATKLKVEKLVHFKPKIPRSEALLEMRKSHLLYYPPILGHQGMYSAKIFDYLGSGSRLLICPDDGDVVADLVTDTAIGEVVTTPIQVSNFIHRCYTEWEQTGTVCCPGDPAIIHHYSRREQVAKLASFLDNLEFCSNE